MDESYEPIRPKPTDPPPLKRLWKAPEEEAAEETVPPRKKKARAGDDADTVPKADPPRKKKKKAEEVIDDGTGAVKLEETPVLDTYEARQRARWIISGVLSSIALIALFLVLKAFKGNGTEEVREGEPPENRVVVDNRAGVEAEARIILDMAKQADKLGRTKAALDQLDKLAKNYQGTAAAREAMHAIDRNKHERPLFGEDIPEQVNGPKAPAPGSPNANGPAVSKDGTKPGPGQARPGDDPASAPVVAAPPPVTKPLPKGYRPKFDYPIHPSGWPTRIGCDIDGAELVLVPAATFLMGRDDGEPSEGPAHEVFVSTYYIDRHEVTIRQYAQFLKETGRPIDPAKLAPREANAPPPPDDLPVVNLSHKEAKAYCNWAARRLPTEAQWELAARGLDKRISYWNGELPRKDPPKAARTMEPVMSLPTDLSPFGAYDLAANAWEWTSEFYDSKYYKQFRNLVSDPSGPKEPLAKIAVQTVKGGSKSGFLTWRDGLKTETRLSYLGFRGALPVEGAPIAPPPAAATPSNAPTLPGGVQPF